MICNFCSKHFKQKHFNQKLCSDGCKKKRTKETKLKYKKTFKGLESEKRWRLNPIKKEIDRAYYTSEKGRAKAVKRYVRLLNSNPYYLFRKRLGQTAPYKKLRHDLILKAKKCRLCMSTDFLTIDHIVPMSLGGEHKLKNIQILCRNCNAKKGQRVSKNELQKMQPKT